VLHATLCELLLELIPSIFESLAGRFDVVDRDGDVSETAVGLRVPIGNCVIGVILRAIVVREFQHGIAVRPVTVTLERLGAVVGKEVKGELVLRKVELLDLIEPKELVKLH
jgi:putative Mn2+ efflux pump MntP